MNEAEKIADELIEKFYPVLGGIEPKDWEYFHKETAKQCAIICCDEMIKQNGEIYLTINSVVNPDMIAHYRKVNAYLFEVKSIIEKK